jgi:hypothetical protein
MWLTGRGRVSAVHRIDGIVGKTIVLKRSYQLAADLQASSFEASVFVAWALRRTIQ